MNNISHILAAAVKDGTREIDGKEDLDGHKYPQGWVCESLGVSRSNLIVKIYEEALDEQRFVSKWMVNEIIIGVKGQTVIQLQILDSNGTKMKTDQTQELRQQCRGKWKILAFERFHWQLIKLRNVTLLQSH